MSPAVVCYVFAVAPLCCKPTCVSAKWQSRLWRARNLLSWLFLITGTHFASAKAGWQSGKLAGLCPVPERVENRSHRQSGANLQWDRRGHHEAGIRNQGRSGLGRGGFGPKALFVSRCGRCVLESARWRANSLRPCSL
jgi:hypothetical protein